MSNEVIYYAGGFNWYKEIDFLLMISVDVINWYKEIDILLMISVDVI